MTTNEIRPGQRVTFTFDGPRYGHVIDIDENGMANIRFGEIETGPVFRFPVHIGRLTVVDGKGNPIKAEPARLLATFRISDQFEGDYDIVVTDELAKPTTTNERTFIVRGRDGVLLNEQADAAKAMASALDVAGWLDHVAVEVTLRSNNAHRGAETL